MYCLMLSFSPSCTLNICSVTSPVTWSFKTLEILLLWQLTPAYNFCIFSKLLAWAPHLRRRQDERSFGSSFPPPSARTSNSINSLMPGPCERGGSSDTGNYTYRIQTWMFQLLVGDPPTPQSVRPCPTSLLGSWLAWLKSMWLLMSGSWIQAPQCI